MWKPFLFYGLIYILAAEGMIYRLPGHYLVSS